MNRIVVDTTTLDKLISCKEPVVICTATGQMVGIFEPNSSLVPHIDETELDRRMLEEDFSTAEVLQYLETL